jgi:hypothetical protein
VRIEALVAAYHATDDELEQAAYSC